MMDGVDGHGHAHGCGPMRGNDDAEKLREMQLSLAASASVFPGFRFSPTDDELISYYLKKKLQGSDTCVDIIPEVDFCRHEPWDLPALSIIRSENEWFFFSARGKKYPNGSQSKRATKSGYWKATGKERNVKSGTATIGTKRTLVFHTGRVPKGERTGWIMHEYCMSDSSQESLVVCRLRRNGDFRLTESPKGSNDHKNQSTTDKSHSGTHENVNAQRDGSDEANPMKSCSKESTSSYMCRLVEQNGSDSNSDRKLIQESPMGSSSPYKDHENEDDCFADIINDDIIKLDESASHSLAFHSVVDGRKCMDAQETISSHGQGTAYRRIKLRPEKGCKQHRNSSSQDHHNKQSDQKPGCVVSVATGNADTVSPSHPTHYILVFVFLLILVIVWQGNYLNSRQLLGIGMEVSKRQLKYWLNKAADYI